jgi:transposase
MFGLNDTYSYYIYPHKINMTSGIEALSELVRNKCGGKFLNGDVYLFFGRQRSQIKILRWDKDGFILYQKRLEVGTFEVPRFKNQEGLIQIKWEAFFMIMRGIPLKNLRFRERFKMP